MELVRAGSEASRDNGLQLVLRTQRHLVVYDPASQEMQLRRADAPQLSYSVTPAWTSQLPHAPAEHGPFACPVCRRPWNIEQEDLRETHAAYATPDAAEDRLLLEQDGDDRAQTAPHYFRLLSESTTPSPRHPTDAHAGMSHLGAEASNPGYYARFFVELGRLGRGARGTVFLCQHVLHGHALGKYAVKKIPVGDYR